MVRRARSVALALLVALAVSFAPATLAHAQDMSRIVYVSRTGSKYHYVSNCSGMKNPTSMTLQEAINKGKTPCSNCVHESGGSTGGGSSSGGTSGGGSSSGSGGTPSVPKPQPISPFTDVYADTGHSDDVSWLYSTGVTTGWPVAGGIEFRPYETVKRCDMAAFLYRLAGSPEFEPTEQDRARFSDVDENFYHAKEIWWLASVGISTGFSDGTFRGMDTVARCDMAAFLKRLALYMGGDVNGMAVNPFRDVNTSTYHRDDILWMVSSEISTGWINGDGSREYRPMSSVTRCDMAAFLRRLKNWCDRSSHAHDWVAQTKTVHHDAATHEEWVESTVQERSICGGCGEDITGIEREHIDASLLSGGDCDSWNSEYVTVEGHYVTVVDAEAWDEEVPNGYRCSTCGATIGQAA